MGGCELYQKHDGRYRRQGCPSSARRCKPAPARHFRNGIGDRRSPLCGIGVIVQLKDALSVVWEVKKSESSGVWHFSWSYAVSLAAVLALGFLLLTSMLVIALVAAFASHAAAYVQEWVLHLLTSLVSLAAVSVLFAMMFKWLSDARVDW